MKKQKKRKKTPKATGRYPAWKSIVEPGKVFQTFKQF